MKFAFVCCSILILSAIIAVIAAYQPKYKPYKVRCIFGAMSFSIVCAILMTVIRFGVDGPFNGTFLIMPVYAVWALCFLLFCMLVANIPLKDYFCGCGYRRDKGCFCFRGSNSKGFLNCSSFHGVWFFPSSPSHEVVTSLSYPYLA